MSPNPKRPLAHFFIRLLRSSVQGQPMSASEAAKLTPPNSSYQGHIQASRSLLGRMSLIKRIGCARHFHRSRVTVDLCFRWLQHKTNRQGRERSAFALSNTLTIFCLNASKQGEKEEGVSNERAVRGRDSLRWRRFQHFRYFERRRQKQHLRLPACELARLFAACPMVNKGSTAKTEYSQILLCFALHLHVEPRSVGHQNDTHACVARWLLTGLG